MKQPVENGENQSLRLFSVRHCPRSQYSCEWINWSKSWKCTGHCKEHKDGRLSTYQPPTDKVLSLFFALYFDIIELLCFRFLF